MTFSAYVALVYKQTGWLIIFATTTAPTCCELKTARLKRRQYLQTATACNMHTHTHTLCATTIESVCLSRPSSSPRLLCHSHRLKRLPASAAVRVCAAPPASANPPLLHPAQRIAPAAPCAHHATPPALSESGCRTVSRAAQHAAGGESGSKGVGCLCVPVLCKTKPVLLFHSGWRPET